MTDDLERAIRDAADIFACFISMMDAGRELDGDERLSDDDVLMSYSGPGCSIFLTAGHFRTLAAALTGSREKAEFPFDV